VRIGTGPRRAGRHFTAPKSGAFDCKESRTCPVKSREGPGIGAGAYEMPVRALRSTRGRLFSEALVRRSQSVKRFVSSLRAATLVLASVMGASLSASASVTSVPETARAASVDQVRCASRGNAAGLPEKVRFKIVSTDEIEVSATYKGQPETAAIFSNRLDVATHPHVAVFPVGANFGITGEAKILLSKEALRHGEVSTLLLINHTSRQSADFQCRITTI